VDRNFPDFAPLLRSDDPTAGDALPQPVQRVLRDIDRSGLEVFGGARHPFRLRGYALIDLNADGRRDVVLATSPFYRQSPTILLYTLDDAGAPSRVIEALAPGPLLPPSGRRIDAHVLELGADMAIGPEEESQDSVLVDPEQSARTFVDMALSRGHHVVRYRDFFHVDLRQSGTAFVDMSRGAVPGGGLDCAAFEFAAVDTLVAGSVVGRGGEPLFVAVVGDSLYGYRVYGIDAQGRLDEETWTWSLPTDFSRLLSSTEGELLYETRDGVVGPLPGP
jgi:hypothetical protein